jgi:hypothetical protein
MWLFVQLPTDRSLNQPVGNAQWSESSPTGQKAGCGQKYAGDTHVSPLDGARPCRHKARCPRFHAWDFGSLT